MDRFLILKPFVYAKSRLFLYFFQMWFVSLKPMSQSIKLFRQGKNEPIVSVIMFVFPWNWWDFPLKIVSFFQTKTPNFDVSSRCSPGLEAELCSVTFSSHSLLVVGQAQYPGIDGLMENPVFNDLVAFFHGKPRHFFERKEKFIMFHHWMNLWWPWLDFADSPWEALLARVALTLAVFLSVHILDLSFWCVWYPNVGLQVYLSSDLPIEPQAVFVSQNRFQGQFPAITSYWRWQKRNMVSTFNRV